MNHVYYVFPEGKFKAETFSYDDNTPEENRHLVEMFNDYHVKATFNLNAGFLKPGTEDEVRRMYQGHEVACHTDTHPTIARCPMGEVIKEISEGKRKLERIVGYPVRGFAYPNRSYSDEIVSALKSCGIRYARMGEVTNDFKLPQDYYHWMGSCHHTEGLAETADAFLERNKQQYLFLCYVWGHGFEFSRDNNWSIMEDFLNKTAQKPETWYCTNIQFADYMDACHALQFTWDNSVVYNPSALTCWLQVNNSEIIAARPGELTKIGEVNE